MTTELTATDIEANGRNAEPTLDIQRLTISYRTGKRLTRVLDDVSLTIRPGEAYGLVGESGSGKSTLALGTARYLAPNAVVESGRILFQNEDVLAQGDARLRELRGSRIAMVYQDPSSSLNPTMTVGEQIAEVFRAHHACTRAESVARTYAVLQQVLFPDPASIFARYRHQLSGGQQQRVVIAMALAGQPSLLVLDEPTTGLDFRTRTEVLALLSKLHKRDRVAMLFISHDLATVRKICDRIGVMRHGRLLEEGAAEQVFTNPQHPYTRALIDCLPGEGKHKHGVRLRPIGDDEESHSTAEEVEAEVLVGPTTRRGHGGDPIIEVRNLGKSFGAVCAAKDASLTVHRGEIVGVIGESGSGKSTLGRMIVGLESPDSGEILLNGRPLASTVERRSRTDKRAIQMVFQRPDTTLNPRRTIRAALSRAITKLGGSTSVTDLAAKVRLGEAQLASVPRRLSGGMKQRVAIARALAGNPDLIICDEPTSALDPSIQASILNRLADISEVSGTACLFISHDLDVVRYLTDRILVLHHGEIVEQGTVNEVLSHPQHPYTRKLVGAAMSHIEDTVPVDVPG